MDNLALYLGIYGFVGFLCFLFFLFLINRNVKSFKGFLSVADVVTGGSLFFIFLIAWPAGLALVPAILIDESSIANKPLIPYRRRKYKVGEILKKKNRRKSSTTYRIHETKRSDRNYQFIYSVAMGKEYSEGIGFWYTEKELDEAYERVPQGKLTEAIYG